MQPSIFIFGYGYVARRLGAELIARGWRVFATTRDRERFEAMAQAGATPLLFDGAQVPGALRASSHLLTSVAPANGADPVLERYGAQIAARAGAFEWAGYLSSTGVYGDRAGAWVSEDARLRPADARNAQRIQAERDWQSIPGLALHRFRLSGIYGPGRGPLSSLRSGTARRIIRPGLVFNRIHVADIAWALHASMRQPMPGTVFNLSDDCPAPPDAVMAYAAARLGLPLPEAEPYRTAALSDAARGFYAQNKRVSNVVTKKRLNLRLDYPTYREGLDAEITRLQRTPGR